MNAHLILPPVAALVLVGVWTGLQRRSIAAIERETVVLRDAIAAARNSAAPAATATLSPPPRGKAADSKEPIDWAELAGQLVEMQAAGGPGGNMRAMMRLQQRLLEFTPEELSAALDEIAALDLSQQARTMLENMLIGIYVQKHPQEALTRFADRLHEQDGGMMWQLSNALTGWAAEDPAAAIAWFDREIAAGTFDSKSLDGKSQARLRFEAALLTNLLGSDPAAAEQRILALPADQRAELLGQVTPNEKDPQGYAELVRATLEDENSISQTLASAAARFVDQGGYERVEKFMDEAGFSPAERIAAVEQAASSSIQRISWQKKVPREEFDNMRDWAGRHAPGSQDKLTGQVLASSAQHGRHTSFAEAAEMAVGYHESSGNDDVLIAFLDSHAARANREEARPLIEKISDPERRAELLEQLK